MNTKPISIQWQSRKSYLNHDDSFLHWRLLDDPHSTNCEGGVCDKMEQTVGNDSEFLDTNCGEYIYPAER